MAEPLPSAADPIQAIRQRLIAIERESGIDMDAQEEAERLEAAEALLGESESHFVNFVEECVNTSSQANRDIRRVQQECWRVYQEDPPPNYANKEDWQSKAIIPKPHGAVQFAMAAVQQAFRPDFLSIEDERDKKLAAFWRKLMQIQFNRRHAKFVRRFTRASGMGFAVGQSFEMIPVWRPGQGLDFSMVEPWKIHRDPDALSEESQSGMYWIHEEWQDLWQLHRAEENGRYVNTRGLQGAVHEENNPQNYHMDRTRQAELRNQLWARNKFRTAALTREYWGTMLDRRGEMLHPRLTYTVAGNRVIGMPRPAPYPSLRWPGVSFSPLPNFLRFEGRSLLQSVRSLWYYMCNLQAMHSDYMNWIVNPMLEINISGLVDEDDVDVFPGRVWQTRDTASGQQVVRTVDRRFTSSEVLANKQQADQDFQRGTFITDPIQGLPGFRQQITARESAQNLQQSLTVFNIIGENLDAGAIDISQAAMETVAINITREELLEIFSMEELVETFGTRPDGLPTIFVDDLTITRTGVFLPRLRGTFHISGLQSLLRDAQTMRGIRDVIIPMTQSEFFMDFLVPHKVAKAIELRSGLQDEGLLVDEDEAEQIVASKKEQQQQMMQIQMQAMQRQQELEEQRQALEVRKTEIEAEQLMLEARKIEHEALQQELESRRKQAELEGNLAEHELELTQKEVEIVRTASDIARTEAEIRANQLRVEGDLRKTDAQIEKTQSQIELAERKMRLQERSERAKLEIERERADIERERALTARASTGQSDEDVS